MNKTNQIQLKIPAVLVVTTGLSILLHDTSMDKAASTALTRPNDVVLAKKVVDDMPHDHTRSSNLNPATTPRAQTRLSDEKKYIINKRLMGSNNDFDYIWPSV